jgi:hypothetical protein
MLAEEKELRDSINAMYEARAINRLITDLIRAIRKEDAEAGRDAAVAKAENIWVICEKIANQHNCDRCGTEYVDCAAAIEAAIRRERINSGGT